MQVPRSANDWNIPWVHTDLKFFILFASSYFKIFALVLTEAVTFQCKNPMGLCCCHAFSFHAFHSAEGCFGNHKWYVHIFLVEDFSCIKSV